MSSDIVKRLREKINTTCNEAADRIEALEGEVERLSKAHDERLKQNTIERAATHKQYHRAEAAEARAERLEGEVAKWKEKYSVEHKAATHWFDDATKEHSRAERLRVALEQIKAWTYDQSAKRTATKALDEDASKDLEDDKQ